MYKGNNATTPELRDVQGPHTCSQSAFKKRIEIKKRRWIVLDKYLVASGMYSKCDISNG